jgi:uncharacterized protein (DUF305 family)
MNRDLKTTALIAALLAFSLGLSACSSFGTGADLRNDMYHGSTHTMEITDRQSFAEAMIPHHQQAIDISQFAPLNTSNPEILSIAGKIYSTQGPEIEKMALWLNGKSVDYTMKMDGMLSTTQVNTLRGLMEADFDQLYAQYMIQHHEGAVKMAADALGLDDPELTDFANEIIVTQSAEIEELMALLNN